MSPDRLELIGLDGIPEVRPGDDIAGLVLDSLGRMELALREGDVLVIAQKIVSKAGGRHVRFADITPRAEAVTLARAAEKDPRHVELILQESREVLRHRPGVIIVLHRLGIVLANAGIDASNVGGDGETVLLLPEDPDATAEAIRLRLADSSGARIAVVVSDSVGRAWRKGTVGIAIGAAGLPALADLRGLPDRFGRALQVSQTGLADAIAAAAGLVQGEGDEGRPVVLVRGFAPFSAHRPAADLIRPEAEDLFR